MPLADIKRRLIKAKEKANLPEDLETLVDLLRRGAFYDELTEEEKTLYCRYLGHTRDALEAVEHLANGTLHFKLERKEKPLTPIQRKERMQEVEALVEEIEAEYNTPEAKAEREREYQEIQRIGTLRRAAMERGESWDKYPLPWERKNERTDKNV